MGNCMETCKQRKIEEIFKPQQQQQQQHDKVVRKAKGFDVSKEQGNDLGKSGIRIKVVLRKDELEMLMLHLSNTKGGNKMRIDEVLVEIERGREKNNNMSNGWKPSLESIMESPEVPEVMDR